MTVKFKSNLTDFTGLWAH